MDKQPKRAVEIPIKDPSKKGKHGVEHPSFKFEFGGIPDSPEKIGSFVKKLLTELELRDIYPEKNLTPSKEALFIEELDTAINEFNLAHPEFAKSKLDLNTIALVLRNEDWHGHYSREHLRALNDFLSERYTLPKTGELEIVPSELPDDVPSEPNEDGQHEEDLSSTAFRGRANKRFRLGLRDSWRELRAAIVRKEMDETKPERARERAHGAFAERNEKAQEAKLQELLALSHRLPRNQFQKIYRELLREAIGPIEDRNGKKSPTLYAKRMAPLARLMEARAKTNPDLNEAVEFVAADAENKIEDIRLMRFLDDPLRTLIARYVELVHATGDDFDPEDFEGLKERVDSYHERILSELVALGREARDEYLTMPMADIPVRWQTFSHGQRMLFITAMQEELLTERSKIGGKDAPAYQELFRIFQKCRDVLANGNDVDPETIAQLGPAIEARRTELEAIPDDGGGPAGEALLEVRTAGDVERLLRDGERIDRITRAVMGAPENLRNDLYKLMAGEKYMLTNLSAVMGALGRTLQDTQARSVRDILTNRGRSGSRGDWEILIEALQKKSAR